MDPTSAGSRLANAPATRADMFVFPELSAPIERAARVSHRAAVAERRLGRIGEPSPEFAWTGQIDFDGAALFAVVAVGAYAPENRDLPIRGNVTVNASFASLPGSASSIVTGFSRFLVGPGDDAGAMARESFALAVESMARAAAGNPLFQAAREAWALRRALGAAGAAAPSPSPAPARRL